MTNVAAGTYTPPVPWSFTVAPEPFDTEDAVRLRAVARLETDGIVGTRSDVGVALTAAMLPTHLVARDTFGTALGCGGIVAAGNGIYEIRRLFVRAGARHLGVGEKLLAELEYAARELGAPAIVYETAPQMTDTVRFFQRHGYQQIAPWGAYATSPHSICVGKSFA